MAVVIHDFEVVAEPPPPPTTAAPPAGAPSTGEPAPHDIARVMRRERERAARVRAH